VDLTPDRHGRDPAVRVRAHRRARLGQFRVDNHPHRFQKNAYQQSLIASILAFAKESTVPSPA
jgi:hypothetical protein